MWVDALENAAFLRNRIPKRSKHESPYEKMFKRKPDVSKILIFDVFTDPGGDPAQVPALYRHSWRVRSIVGCTDGVKGYRFCCLGQGMQSSKLQARE